MATLKVTIHEARDLPVMDRATGLADPYVVVSLNAESYTTEIDTGTCNPVWNKELRFDAANLLTLQEDPVEFRVFDHDIVTRDDLIGLLYIDLNCILGREVPTLSGWFPLYDTMAGLHGELRVTLKVKFHAAENPTAPRVPNRLVRHMGGQNAVASALRRLGAGQDDKGMPACDAVPVSSPALQYQIDVDEFQPIGYIRSHQPSLTTEEEGVHIFSMSRLDPSVFRVESVLPMVEELIVKADPEHSKFTTLRSSRATNEARILQLFKLSGKVRRQLSRKVLELHCNCVLGYEERYDLESNGIIVRAYGTPCVISSVKYTVREWTPSAQAGSLLPSMPPLPVASSSGTPITTDQAPLAGTARSSEDTPTMPTIHTTEFTSMDGVPFMEPTVSGGPLKSSDPEEKVLRVNHHSHTAAQSATRSQVVTLTVSDVPSGMLYHVGGLVSARSVKLVSKLKSKLLISQERDAWWSELREEVKYNARSLHCNAIVAYEEVAMYDHEDVVVLSISGTAVVLDTSWVAMRCGPENLYHRLAHRLVTGKSCSILHLYDGGSHQATGHHHHQGRHHSGASRREEANTATGFLCTTCRKKSVPEVILTTCTLPLDVNVDGPPVLIQAVVSKMKPNVKGAELALCLSQAIPFLEFSLHKQLMFKMQLERMNAAFSVQVHFAVGSDVVVATLTATAFRLVGLPIPQAPKLEFWDPERIPSDTVSKLQAAVERAKHYQRSRRRPSAAAATSQVMKRRGTSHDPGVQSATRSPQISSSAPNDTSVVGLGVSGSSASGGSSSDEDTSTHDTWVSSSSSQSDEDDVKFPTKSEIMEYTVVIDDEEEAELMLGMISGDARGGNLRLDDIVCTVPYIPTEANRYAAFHERLNISRRYSVRGRGGMQSHSNIANGEMSTSFFNSCFVNARLAFLMHLRRLAVRKSTNLAEGIRVFHFHVRCVFEPNTNDFHVVLDGLVCGAHVTDGRRVLSNMQNRAFDESESLLLTARIPNSIGSSALTLMRNAIAAEDTRNNANSAQTVAEEAAEASYSDVHASMGGGNGNGNGGGGMMSTMSTNLMDVHSLIASAPAALEQVPLSSSVNGRRLRYHRKARKTVFTRSNAPFSLPFVFRRESVTLPSDPFTLLEGRSAAALGGAEAKFGERMGGSEQTKRTGVVQRQLHALASLASATFRNFADKIGVGSEVPHSGTGGAAGEGPTRTLTNLSGTMKALVPNASGGGGGGTSNATSGLQKFPMQQLLQPCWRVPADRAALLAYDDPFYITPLCYVAGCAVARYIGRISQHFIREAYEIYSADELGAFFTNTDLEIHGVVRALVKALGGNALLSHTMQLHEVWDSDGSGCAFLCMTITGHVALVSKEAVGEEHITSFSS